MRGSTPGRTWINARNNDIGDEDGSASRGEYELSELCCEACGEELEMKEPEWGYDNE